MNISEPLDLNDALDFDLFQGDYGAPGDTELANKIVTGRGVYKCFICKGEISKGERHRSCTWIFDGELMSYRCCNPCCVAMVASVNCDYEEDDPIDARYSIGEKRSKRTTNE